jgi:hypothetical protein
LTWARVAPAWQNWSVSEFRSALAHAKAEQGFAPDKRARGWCDACVLVLPAGMSAHFGAGWCAGRGKRVVIDAPEIRESELMYKLFDRDAVTPIYGQIDEVVAALTATTK